MAKADVFVRSPRGLPVPAGNLVVTLLNREAWAIMLYVLLGVVGVAVLAFTLSRVPTRALMAALVAMGASLGVSDLIVSGLLRLYTFRPHLFAGLRQDNGVGVLLADFIFVSFMYASLVMLLPRHRPLATIAFAALVSVLEVIFVRLGIFIHHRWSFWYTPLLFAVRFAVSIWWLSVFENRGYTRGFRWLVVVGSTLYLWFIWVVISSAILRLWQIRLGLLAPLQDVVLGSSLLHGLPFILGGVACVMIDGVGKAIRLGALVVAMALYLTGLKAAGLWHDRAPWNPIAGALAMGVLTWVVLYLDQWMSETPRARIPAWHPPD